MIIIIIIIIIIIEFNMHVKDSIAVRIFSHQFEAPWILEMQT